jgi:hypothetical protein
VDDRTSPIWTTIWVKMGKGDGWKVYTIEKFSHRIFPPKPHQVKPQKPDSVFHRKEYSCHIYLHWLRSLFCWISNDNTTHCCQDMVIKRRCNLSLVSMMLCPKNCASTSSIFIEIFTAHRSWMTKNLTNFFFLFIWDFVSSYRKRTVMLKGKSASSAVRFV